MEEPIAAVRKAIIEKLSEAITINGETIKIYNRVPTDASYPYIKVYSVSTDETDENQTTFITQTITRIECVTRFTSNDGGQLICNVLVNQCLRLLRTRSSNYIDLSSSGYNVYTSVNEGVNYLEDDLSDYTYFRGIIELSNKIEQT
ncbi:MAG: hypothetical protein Unbinned5434contig1000_27 [Prokaryotic dsDNA virus sp.]|mgnify:CR=1 FL=1|jgi:hypothetical protein|nr:MAG: hypothetical protein Unbinned5434contig1000_27 [Prokaryotic dsDNA virus sp.]|tara:strand:+ start:7675 stop:8112 length:438 start_codon:yes stop_codon:yes gene_type:complete